MSTRAEATARNQTLINSFTATQEGFTRTAKASAFAAAQRATNDMNSIRNGIDVVQSQFSSRGLSQTVIDAQQRLSEKYGIPTFDVKGFISTVPLTRDVDLSINVGTGALTQSAFRRSIEVLTKSAQGQFDPTGTINTAIFAPIQEFIDDILGSASLADLTPEELEKIASIDRSIANWRNQLARTAKRPDLRRSITLAINKLIAEKNAILTQSKLLTRFTEEVEKVTASLQALIIADNFTIELRAEAEQLFTRTNLLLNEIAKRSVKVPRDALIDLGQKTRILRQRFAEPIIKQQDKVNNDINLLESFLGLGAILAGPFEFLASAFESAFNPTTEQIIEREIKTAQANLQAIKAFKEMGLIPTSGGTK